MTNLHREARQRERAHSKPHELNIASSHYISSKRPTEHSYLTLRWQTHGRGPLLKKWLVVEKIGEIRIQQWSSPTRCLWNLPGKKCLHGPCGRSETEAPRHCSTDMWKRLEPTDCNRLERQRGREWEGERASDAHTIDWDILPGLMQARVYTSCRKWISWFKYYLISYKNASTVSK